MTPLLMPTTLKLSPEASDMEHDLPALPAYWKMIAGFASKLQQFPARPVR